MRRHDTRPTPDRFQRLDIARPDPRGPLCPRCGRGFGLTPDGRHGPADLDPVELKDAASPTVIVHHMCTYDVEWANGSASRLTTKGGS